MMKKHSTALVDAHLESLVGMEEHTTVEYFYTRLKARMDNRAGDELSIAGLKPVWLVGSMAVLFVINICMLSIKMETKQLNAAESISIKSFAEAYDQTLSSF